MVSDAETPKVQYPHVTVKLTGEDGNAFDVIGAVSRELRRQVGQDAVTQFVSAAMFASSYDELLRLIQRTVNVE